MPQNDPWAQFPAVSQAGASGPVYGAPPKPEKPDAPKTTYRPLSPAETASAGLPAGGVYQVNSEGKIDAVVTPKADAVGGQLDPKTVDGQRNIASGILKNAGIDFAKNVDPVRDLIAGSTSGRLQRFGADMYGAVTGDATDGMENIARLATIGNDMVLQMSGGSLGAQISNSDRDFIAARMGDIANPNKTSDERLAAWDQVKTRLGAISGVEAPQPDQRDQAIPPAFGAGAAGGGQPPAPGGSEPIVPPTFSPGDPRMQVNTSGYRNEDDPELVGRGVRAAYAAMLEQSVKPGQVVAKLREMGVTNPTLLRTAAQQAQFRQQHPDVPLDRYDYEAVDDRPVAMSPLERGANAVMGNSVTAPIGSAIIGAGQFLSGNTLDNIGGEQAAANLDLARIQNPNAYAVGEIAGGVMGSLGGEAALGGAGMAPGFMRGLVADAGMGAANAAGAADGPDQSRGLNAMLGGAAGAAGSTLGNITGRGVNALARGVSSPAVNQMNREVGGLTVGQAYGQSGRVGAAVKGVEDRLSGVPVVGDMVNARRADTFTRFNSKAFDKALEPIGGRINGKVGADAVSDAASQVQDAFKAALQGKIVQADAPFVNEMAQAATKAFSVTRVGPELGENIADILGPHMQRGGNTIDGETMQIISRELRTLKAAYKTKEPALYKRISAAIESTENAVFGLFRRQAPEVLPAYDAAKQAYRRVSILSDATLKGKNQPDSMFTPAQLNAADAANAKKYDGAISAAAGPRQFREYGEAGQAVLPNKVPDSGTAGRLLVGGAGVGAIAGGGLGAVGGDPAGGAGSGAGAGLTMAAVLAAAYTKAGQRVLTKPARGMQGRAGQALSDPRLQRILSKLGGASAAASLPGTAPSP